MAKIRREKFGLRTQLTTQCTTGCTQVINLTAAQQTTLRVGEQVDQQPGPAAWPQGQACGKTYPALLLSTHPQTLFAGGRLDTRRQATASTTGYCTRYQRITKMQGTCARRTGLPWQTHPTARRIRQLSCNLLLSSGECGPEGSLTQSLWTELMRRLKDCGSCQTVTCTKRFTACKVKSRIVHDLRQLRFHWSSSGKYFVASNKVNDSGQFWSPNNPSSLRTDNCLILT